MFAETVKEKSSLLRAVGKLAIAGEQAGFTLEQMIELLSEGLSVKSLLGLISLGLAGTETSIASRAGLPGSIVWPKSSSGGLRVRSGEVTHGR